VEHTSTPATAVTVEPSVSASVREKIAEEFFDFMVQEIIRTRGFGFFGAKSTKFPIRWLTAAAL
jgi:hypothetical protein